MAILKPAYKTPAPAQASPKRAGSTLSKAVIRAASLLEISQSTVADILGISSATASRLFAGNYQLQPERRREWELATLFVRLFRSLDAIAGHGAQAQQWLQGPNRAFADQPPIKLLHTTEGLVRVLHYLDATRGRI
jgi:uncharacterized protein (DUF2384 family)